MSNGCNWRKVTRDVTSQHHPFFPFPYTSYRPFRTSTTILPSLEYSSPSFSVAPFFLLTPFPVIRHRLPFSHQPLCLPSITPLSKTPPPPPPTPPFLCTLLGVDYHSLIDLSALFRVWNPQRGEFTNFSQDHCAKVITFDSRPY